MVEGPGCTRNGQKVRATLLGKKVSGVAGSASSTVANAIRGRTLVDAITLGKQLWLIFAGTEATHDEHAVRCHFGMNGSLHCNSKQPPAHAGPLSLLIKFADGGEARLLQATVTLADAQAARRAVSEARDRDVCSAAFDEAAALAALAAVPADWMACDALLDQAVLPGVGNIIKNEALHEVGIDPRRPMGSLSAQLLPRLVRALRAFSLAWCRQGRHPACKVCNRTLTRTLTLTQTQTLSLTLTLALALALAPALTLTRCTTRRSAPTAAAL